MSLSNTTRFGKTSFVPGITPFGQVCGYGVRGALVPTIGTYKSYLLNDLDLPADNEVEFWGQIETFTTKGTLSNVGYAGEFDYTPSVAGTDSFTYRLYADGIGQGTAAEAIVVTANTDTKPEFIGPNIGDLSGTVGGTITPFSVASKFSGANRVYSKTGTWPSGMTLDTAAGTIGGTYSPVGTYSVSVTATNSGGGATSNVLTVTVAAVPNSAPVAVGDTATVQVGSTVVVNVLSNDSDSDGTLNAASVEIVAQAISGTAVANSDGTVSYTASGNTPAGTYTVLYKLKDDQGAYSNTAAITITVTTAAPPVTGTITTLPLLNRLTGQLHGAVEVYWSFLPGWRVGTAVNTTVFGSTVLGSDSILRINTGLASGTVGELEIGYRRDSNPANDLRYSMRATVA